jgi:glycosyltransferase involved in cell wall biosynthesis
MRRLSTELGHKRVRFVGPKYGEDKLTQYRKASVYVLPSFSENFGMTVAEALAAGLPAIVSKGAPWSGLSTRNCGWWIENDKASILRALIEAAKTDTRELREMGLRGRRWMDEEFGWERIGRMMSNVYTWQIG